MRIRLYLTVLLAAMNLGLAVVARAEKVEKGSHVQFYLENYLLVDPASHPQVARARAVFDQMRRVADRKGKYEPQLRVVDNSSGDPWAIALPDGYIVLSRKAVEIAYQDGDPAEGDARIAFVLGHELAHLAKDDFWHREIYQTLATMPEGKSLRKLLKQNADVSDAAIETQLVAAKHKEWQADDWGFLYASLAGYPTQSLLGAPAAGKPHFFDYWMQQTQTQADEVHPTPRERATGLRARLQSIQDKLEFFYVGVQLMHFGRHEDAVYFLQEFQHEFPAREVLGNLGLGYLQLARKAMAPETAERYCLPTLLDTQTRAAGLTIRGGDADTEPTLSPKAQEFLERAVEYLRRAVEADRAYLPARLNLATAYFYLGEIYQARAVIEEARQLAPSREEVDNLRALILYRDGLSTDMWPYALQVLEDLAARPNASPCVAYNLARILEERGRANKAQALWAMLAARKDELSPDQRGVVCRMTANQTACQSVAVQEKSAVPAPIPWTLPAPIGFDLRNQPGSAKKYFAGWRDPIPFDWEQRGMNGHLYTSPAGLAVLDLDGYVEMITLRGSDLGAAADLPTRCGTQLVQKTVTSGELLTCDNRWAVLIQDGQVREAWVVRR